jgi:hypothetical protein
LSGAEPPNAPEGGLAYATDTELVRVKTATVWKDVGAAAITEIDAGTGIIVTDGTGPVVTISADTNPSTSPFVLKDLNASYTHDPTPSRDDRAYLQDSGTGASKESRIRELPVIEKDFSNYTFTLPSVNSDIVYNVDGSPGTVRTCNMGDQAIAGQVTGRLGTTAVVGITETSGPTALTIGNINDFQLLQRVGSTVVGTAYPATTLVGDANGSITANTVNAIHETSGPTQLSFGAISAGQVLVRSGATIIGSTAGTPTGNPFIDPPVTAGSLDDEFDTGSADLAVRGWTIKNSAGSTMTRVGDIAPWSVGSLTSTQYNSTLIGSFLHIEVALGTDVRIYKSISWASGSGSMLWARMGQPQYRSLASTQTNYIGVSAWYNSGGNPDGNNRVLSQVSTLGTTAAVNVQTGRVTAGAASVTTTNSAPPAPDIYGIKLLSGTTSWDCFVANSQTGSLATDSTGTMISTSMAFAGVSLVPAATTGAATTNSQIFTIDFIRSGSGANAWIGQTPRPVAWNVVDANITDYSSKATPVAADQIYIADSAASNAIKRATLASISAQPASQYWAASTSPSAIDDTFLTGSSDMATRGWTCINPNTSATMTRVGDVLPLTNGNAATAGNTYRSTLTASGMLIQCATEVWFFKVTPSAGDMTVACDVSGPTSSTNAGHTTRLCLFNSVTPNLSSGTLYMFFTEYFNALRAITTMTTGNTFTQLGNVAATAAAWKGTTAVLDYHSSGLGVRSMDPITGGLVSTLGPFGTVTVSPTFRAVGIMVGNNVAAPLAWWQFRSFKWALGSAWPMI